MRADQKRLGALLHKTRKGRIDLGFGAGVKDLDLQVANQWPREKIFTSCSRRLESSDLVASVQAARVHKRGKMLGARQQRMQEPEPLGPKLRIFGIDTGDVAAWPIEVGDEAGLDRVVAGLEDNRNRAR